MGDGGGGGWSHASAAGAAYLKFGLRGGAVMPDFCGGRVQSAVWRWQHQRPRLLLAQTVLLFVLLVLLLLLLAAAM